MFKARKTWLFLDDLGMSWHFSEVLDIMFEPHAIESFAKHYYHVIDRFGYLIWVLSTEDVGALSLNRTRGNK